MSFSTPIPLTENHDLSEFDCGITVLNSWLNKHALKNETAGACRTYVTLSEDKLAGFYSMAAGSVASLDTPGKVRRNMPTPVPVMILGRLAVDSRYQGKGVGQLLLSDALLRTNQAADIIGIRAIMVHAISEEARAFYLRYGFVESPSNRLTLFLTLKDIRASLNASME